MALQSVAFIALGYINSVFFFPNPILLYRYKASSLNKSAPSDSNSTASCNQPEPTPGFPETITELHHLQKCFRGDLSEKLREKAHSEILDEMVLSWSRYTFIFHLLQLTLALLLLQYRYFIRRKSLLKYPCEKCRVRPAPLAEAVKVVLLHQCLIKNFL